VLFLFICLILILFNRVPTVRTPQKIKAFGIEMDVSVITVLVLVGLVLSLTSTFMEVKNYEDQLAVAQRQTSVLETALARSGKTTISALVKLEGVETTDDMPDLNDVYCRYFVRSTDKDGWVEGAKVNPGIYGLDFRITLEDVTPATNIEKFEVTDRNPKKFRTWSMDHVGYILSPTYPLKRVKPAGGN